jgi:CDP-diacylglycerol--glycerol-3-phosphate 3-phosphatidyltransferase
MNLPNKITVGRLAMTVVFLSLAMVPAESQQNLIFWKISYLIAFVAGLTDILDGYLARRLNLVTDFGALVDPLTDKIFTVSCFVVLVEHHIVPAWVTILILAREFAVTGLRSLAANKGVVLAAEGIGKLKTLFQMLTLLAGGLIWVQWWEPAGAMIWAWKGILWALAIFTLYSGFEYFRKNSDLYMQET